MLRNFLKGVIGDKINSILAGAAFNFRIALREIKEMIYFWVYFIYPAPISKQKSQPFLFPKLKTKVVFKMIF